MLPFSYGRSSNVLDPLQVHNSRLPIASIVAHLAFRHQTNTNVVFDVKATITRGWTFNGCCWRLRRFVGLVTEVERFRSVWQGGVRKGAYSVVEQRLKL